ncbi:hypothetical protein [Streptomyces rishiriensis]|uniref:Uncharacterized protein n=1 Tax=Streptomyces rishiriensis TaxID=68264 RepID=A0ABU0P4G0_STRRH|nr:hypothetical protein [Streptomyces rishiriensis]MDQ0585627.1 hypothetical protein [Streptomyces rishiriensis]
MMDADSFDRGANPAGRGKLCRILSAPIPADVGIEELADRQAPRRHAPSCGTATVTSSAPTDFLERGDHPHRSAARAG